MLSRASRLRKGCWRCRNRGLSRLTAAARVFSTSSLSFPVFSIRSAVRSSLLLIRSSLGNEEFAAESRQEGFHPPRQVPAAGCFFQLDPFFGIIADTALGQAPAGKKIVIEKGGAVGDEPCRNGQGVQVEAAEFRRIVVRDDLFGGEQPPPHIKLGREKSFVLPVPVNRVPDQSQGIVRRDLHHPFLAAGLRQIPGKLFAGDIAAPPGGRHPARLMHLEVKDRETTVFGIPGNPDCSAA